MLPIYCSAIGVSAFLLFLVQPMMARMLLPLLGGTPLVWSTLLAFFQTILLLGYFYVYATTRWLHAKVQVTLHCCILFLPFFFLPLQIATGSPPVVDHPATWLIFTLLKVVGIPFFAVSTTSPLLQQWFSRASHTRSADPYFLYAASNFGSFAALLSYPIFVEPNVVLRAQSKAWSIGYSLLVALLLGAALHVPRGMSSGHESTPKTHDRLPRLQRFHWLVLAFIPSSLMSSVTTFIATDLGSIPLWWVVPLALYLLTFIIAFSGKPAWMCRATPASIAFMLPPMALLAGYPPSEHALPVALVHTLFFFAAALFCHIALANDRPSTNHLAEYYLWMSAGGALGGIFNAFVAPVIFTSITEYPLSVGLLAYLALYRFNATKEDGRKDILLAAVLGLCLGACARWLGLDFGVGRQGTSNLF